MVWYYADEHGNQVGPLDASAFADAVKSGAIRGGTLVWREGFAKWVQFSTVAGQPSGESAVVAGSASGAGAIMCSVCGGRFSQDELVDFEGIKVCAACKPQYIQTLREGAAIVTRGSYWRSGKLAVIPRDGALPQRCVRCNDPVEGQQIKKRVYWHSPVFYVLLVSPIIYLIAILFIRKQATPHFSVCPPHRAARRKAIVLSCLFILAGIAGIILGAAQEMLWLVWAGCGLIVIAIGYAVAKGRFIYATKIDKEHVWVAGCKPVFLAELPEWPGK